MIVLLCFILAVLAAPIKSKMRLEAENLLRHQLTVLRRRLQGHVQLTNKDRRLLIVLYRWFPSILQVLTPREDRLPRPATALPLECKQGALRSALNRGLACIGRFET
jgi:hypothetical protein